MVPLPGLGDRVRSQRDLLANAANTYEDVTLGVLSERDFESQKTIIAPYLDTPGGRAFWARFRERYPAEFQVYVEREIVAKPDVQ